MNELLRAEHLFKLFPLDKKSAVYAVNDVSLILNRGETLGLVGESGSGKTTVGRVLLRLVPPTSGRLFFDGEEMTEWSGRKLRQHRRRMALVFQDPYMSLNPMMTGKQTIEEPLVLEGGLDRAAREARILETIEAVQLSTAHLHRYPGEMTASEQQRVAIARAIIARPSFVVVDEATSNLDARSRSTILDVLIRLQRELGVCYLFISHDLTAVEKVSHRIAIMYLGRIVEVATKTTIMRKQLHPYSRALLSAVLYPDPSRRLEQFTLQGEIPSGINPPDECPLVGRCPLAVPMCREAFPPLEEVETDHYSACYRSRDLAGSNGLGGPVDGTEASVPIGEIANTEGRIGGSGL